MKEVTSQAPGRRNLNKFQGTPKVEKQQHQLKKKKKKKKKMGLHKRRQLASSLTGRNNPRSKRSSKSEHRKEEECIDDGESSGDDDEVDRLLIELQKLVPGSGNGESSDESSSVDNKEVKAIDKLFEETFDYILSLQVQLNTLKFLTGFTGEIPGLDF